jgi:photosystem II stability/assembly factor-like uncharacterized protein
LPPNGPPGAKEIGPTESAAREIGLRLPPRLSEGGWLLAGAADSGTVYVSRDQGQSWEAEPETGFEVTGAVRQEERLYLLTRQHGVLEQESAAAAVDVRPGGE